MNDGVPSVPPSRPGWRLQDRADTFSAAAGPYWFREPPGPTGVGFEALARHANAGGSVHGGAILTLADMALWEIIRREIGPFMGGTVSLNMDFAGAGGVGSFIEATGEPVRTAGKLLFARGVVTSGGSTLATFSGVVKRWTPR